MDDSGALPGEMSRRLDLDPLPLDRQTAERILAGSVSPADAPPGYADVAWVMRAAAGPPAPAELAGEVEAVALLAAELRAGTHSPVPAPRRSSVLSRTLTARFAAAAVAGTLSLTTGLAAADVLPDPAQDVASNVLDKVGISVPSADTGAEVTMTLDTEATVDAAVSTTTALPSGSPAPVSSDPGDPAPNVLSPTGAPASADESADEPNHGTAVCKVASDGKCKPDHADDADEDADDDPPGQEGFGYAKQIEHCQDKGQAKQARFQGKTKQSDKAADQAQDCQEKFANKKNEPAEPATPTTDTTPGDSNAGSNHTDDSGEHESDDEATDDDESDDDEQGDDGDDDAHPPADPGSKGQGLKKGHDHAPGQSGRH
jgi:hypothetical protein